MIKVEIDEGSGFCFGVVTAIHKAEEELAKGETLYCLGSATVNSCWLQRKQKCRKNSLQESTLVM